MRTLLVYCLYGAYDSGEKRHPQVVIRDLGLTPDESIPQSIADCWHFWFNDDVDIPLPRYIQKLRE